MQRGATGAAVYGLTRPGLKPLKLKTEWNEEKVGAKKVKLWLKSVQVKADFDLRVFIMAEAQRGTTCYKFIEHHENKHVKVWYDGIRKIAPKAVNLAIKTSHPIFTSPAEVDAGKVKAKKKEVEDAIKGVTFSELVKQGEKISAKSKKVDNRHESELAELACG